MIITAKAYVCYELDENLKAEIIKVRDLINFKLDKAHIYIFGSVAKGRYYQSSDIDVLVLINEEKTLKELRGLRHEIEDSICNLNLSKDIDLKIYTKERFCELIKVPSFESAILKDLVEVRGWDNG